MILASLQELYQQIPALPRLRQALDFIHGANAMDLPDGRIAIDGERMFALVQSYQTLPLDEHAEYEAHRKYIDVQYISSGVELMGWAALDQLQVSAEYSPTKDVILGACPPGVATLVRVDSGQAVIFFPADAHAPKYACGEPCAVKKIVIKVAVMEG